MAKTKQLRWASEPTEHDYPAAALFLGLIAGQNLVSVLTALLSQAPTVHRHPQDILRAARLPLLPVDDLDVARDLKKIGKGIALSPVLLVRGDIATGVPVQVADGYHRICASYHLAEDSEIPCRIVSVPAISV